MLNPSSVVPNELIIFGPLYKIMVGEELKYVYDYDGITKKSRYDKIIHVQGHYKANSFFCPSCNLSLKCKRTLKGHMDSWKTKSSTKSNNIPENNIYDLLNSKEVIAAIKIK